MMYFRYHKSKSHDKSKRKNSLNRRKLKNENLDLMLKSSETLLEDFIELEVQYIGKLKCVPTAVDITIKKNLLKQMMEAQNQNDLPKVLTVANDSILRLNAFILELLTRDNNEQMIIALPVHNISNICYTKEAENSHVIAIQSGDSYENNEYSEVSLVVVKTKNEAEIICQLFKKCFELLYIERTMSLLDQVIGDDTYSNCSTSVSVVERHKKRIPINKKSTIRINNIDDVKSMVSISLENSKKLESTSKENQAINKALNEVAHETIEDFIGQLKKELNKSEYESFGIALTEWQKGKSFESFCSKALSIVGNSRLHIIVAIKPFIPNENLEWFKKFIKINNDSLKKTAFWSSDSSLNSNSDAESILSHYFSDVLDQKKTKNTGTGM